MKRNPHLSRMASVGLVGVAAACGVVPAAPAGAAVKFTRITTLGVGPIPDFGMARTKDGTLHLIYQTTAPGSSVPNGLAARSISAGGAVHPPSQALTGWGTSRPGLITLPNGTLAAVFGAISPGPNPVSSIWAIGSANGGATWSAPADVRGGALESLAYASDVTAQLSGTTPVLTLPQAGNLVIQQGLGAGASTSR